MNYRENVHVYLRETSHTRALSDTATPELGPLTISIASKSATSSLDEDDVTFL